MLGAMMGGGMSASSGASASQDSANNVSSGTISVGGLNMGAKSFLDSDGAKIAIGGAVLLGVFYMLSKSKKRK
jgi:hypothetical protein